jgi:hypothetical protein
MLLFCVFLITLRYIDWKLNEQKKLSYDLLCTNCNTVKPVLTATSE